jgi:glycosyltransferase involved in cell wall biosynthesis
LNSKPDVVHVQWINAGFMSIRDLADLNLPIVWRLPDWWLLTGGCHLPYDCKKYELDCSKCPCLGEPLFIDKSKLLLRRKRLDISRLQNVKFVCPSRALAADAARSTTISNADIRVIPNGLDLNIYKPISQKDARNRLDLPVDKKIILFGAVNGHSDPNKGYYKLLEALTIVRERMIEKPICVSFGDKPGVFDHCGITIKSLGVIRDQVQLNTLYSAGDVMVVPSYQESFGQTAIEAMASGVPVVAFRTTGLIDIVDHGYTGYLAERYDAKDLANCVFKILTSNDSYGFRARAREKVETNYDIKNVVASYLKLYHEISEVNVK